MTLGEDRDHERPLHPELGLAAQLSFRHNGAVKRTQYRPLCSDSPANLTLHRTLTHKQDPSISILFERDHVQLKHNCNHLMHRIKGHLNLQSLGTNKYNKC